MFWKYIKAAWNAKFGMPVPLNWFILAFGAVLTYKDWGLGIVFAGVEAGYLLFLASSKSFHQRIKNEDKAEASRQLLEKIKDQRAALQYDDRERYDDLVNRCKTIIEQQKHETPADTLQQQAEGLSRLANFYLQLLVSKTAIESMPISDDAPSLTKMCATVTRKLNAAGLSEETRKSLSQQLDILHQRQQAQKDAQNRLEYIEAELQRIEQQIELLREQTVADTAPSVVSDRIDAVTSTLTGTNDWMKTHRELVGSVDDMWSAPPPIVQAQIEEN